MKFAVVVFPGSNCDHDAHYAAEHVLGQQAEYIWHKETSLKGADVVILPGGFAHGDYLRTGAIARFSPIMAEVQRFAASGGPVLGICNGFQVLLEAGLLPGAMLRNRSVKFQCEHVLIKVEETNTPFTTACVAGQILRIPIAHGEGNYYAEPDVVARLERNRQVVFRYTTANGIATDEANPNGSVANIAGLCNEDRNVVGLILFESAVKAVSEGAFTAAAR
jgi:phosphoribosylformylglycinamidine synthase subunit PurQ / glutaminase